MKKAIKLLTLTVACCAAAISFVGCSDKKTATGSPDSLQFDTKYYYHYDMHNNKNGGAEYYVFYADGTCVKYNQSGRTVNSVYVKSSETVTTYKYAYLDEQKTGVACFFDSKKITYYEDDGVTVRYVNTGSTESDDKDYRVLSISKNVLTSSSVYGYSFYINEDYVDEIPNFYPEKSN